MLWCVPCGEWVGADRRFFAHRRARLLVLRLLVLRLLVVGGGLGQSIVRSVGWPAGRVNTLSPTMSVRDIAARVRACVRHIRPF